MRSTFTNLVRSERARCKSKMSREDRSLQRKYLRYLSVYNHKVDSCVRPHDVDASSSRSSPGLGLSRRARRVT